MRIIRYLLVLMLVMGCAKDEPVPTQGDIAGKVTDSNDGSPISGANVSLSGDQRSTTTSSDGNFTFKSLVAGSYSVTAIKNGYVAASRTVTVTPEKTASADIQIKKDLPRVSVQEVVFNKDNISEEKSMTLTNTREGDMSYTLQPSKSWIKVTPSSGTIPEGNQAVIKINIEYGSIEFGTYNEFIVINVGQASVSIPINITYDAPQFTVTVTAGDGGEVDTDGGIYAQGTELTITATPFQGYAFNKWSNGSQENPYTFTVNQNVTLNATFTVLSYDVIANVEGEGTVEQTLLTSGSVENYVYNSTIRLEAKPSPGWKFKEWTGDYVGEDNPIELTVDQEKEVTANFIRKEYILDVLTEGEGTVAEEVIVQPSNSYQYETEVRLTATPEAGWVFSNWSGDASGSENPLDVKIEGATSIKAVFKRAQYNLDITTVGEGTVTQEVVVAPTVTSYDYESVIKLTATPTQGWGFSSWTGDIESTENPVEVAIDGNKSVTLTFIELDTDGDGITDPNDQCPDTPSDEEADENGCSISQKDTDGDGVNDAIDQCPDTPSDEEADANGCAPSQKDTDGDGVNNAIDECADTPSGKAVDSKGCTLVLTIDGETIPSEITVGEQLRIKWTTNYTDTTVKITLKPYQSDNETVLQEGLDITEGEYVWLVDPNLEVGFYQVVIYDEATDQKLDDTSLIEVVTNCEELPMQDSVFEEWLFNNGYDDLLDNKVDSCRMAEITEMISPSFSTRVDFAIFTSLVKIQINGGEIDGDFPADVEIDLSVISSLVDIEINGSNNSAILKWNPENLERLKIEGSGMRFSQTVTFSTMPKLQYFYSENFTPTIENNLSDYINPNLKHLEIQPRNYGTVAMRSFDLSGLENLEYFGFYVDSYSFEMYHNEAFVNLCGLTQLNTVRFQSKFRKGSPYNSTEKFEILISEDMYNAVSWTLPNEVWYQTDYYRCENLDSDGDGINDPLDSCQGTPVGEVIDENGCSDSQKDTDNDGVNDALDQCPDTPSNEDVDANGCAPSQKDSDNDGVNDDIDLCPNTMDGEEVDEYGCTSGSFGSEIEISSIVGYGRYNNDTYKTVDGGETWTVVNGRAFLLYEFINSEIGFASDGYDLHKTVDGGENWEVINGRGFYAISFVDENIGFGASNNNVYKTLDGGNNWTLFSGYNPFIISFPHEDVGYGSRGSDIKRFNSNGNYVSISNTRLEEIEFINGGTGYGMVYMSDLVKTKDGGVTWYSVSDKSFSNISFINEEIGFASNDEGLYRTEDGGITWILINDINFNYDIKIDFVPGN